MTSDDARARAIRRGESIAAADRLDPAAAHIEDVPGLEAVKAALATQNAATLLNFLLHPDDRLNGRRPIDVLRAGDVDAVVNAAWAVATMGY
jgi:hypothetical protein